MNRHGTRIIILVARVTARELDRIFLLSHYFAVTRIDSKPACHFVSGSNLELSKRAPHHQNRSIYWCCNRVVFLSCETGHRFLITPRCKRYLRGERPPRHENFQFSCRTETIGHYRSLLVSIQAFNSGFRSPILPIRTHSDQWFWQSNSKVIARSEFLGHLANMSRCDWIEGESIQSQR
jgi:hypothetical protein